MPVPGVRLYSRETCGLCDKARDVLLAIRAELAFDFEEILIDGDPELEREYGLRVPVVLLDDEEVFEIEVDENALRGLLHRG